MATPATLSQFYSSIGQTLPTLSERSGLYESYGLGSASSYRGAEGQNVALLNRLAGGGPTVQASQPTLNLPAEGSLAEYAGPYAPKYYAPSATAAAPSSSGLSSIFNTIGGLYSGAKSAVSDFFGGFGGFDFGNLTGNIAGQAGPPVVPPPFPAPPPAVPASFDPRAVATSATGQNLYAVPGQPGRTTIVLNIELNPLLEGAAAVALGA